MALPLYRATSGAVPVHCIRLFPPPGCGNNGFVRTWNPFFHSCQKQKPDISPTLHASAAKLMLHRVFFALPYLLVSAFVVPEYAVTHYLRRGTRISTWYIET